MDHVWRFHVDSQTYLVLKGVLALIAALIAHQFQIVIGITVRVVLIVGISGACRKAELTSLHIEDIVDEGTHMNFKCYVHPVEINTIGNIGLLPKIIAQMIGLPNHALFTGHYFRRPLATLLSDYGAFF
ncbi:hypothetical protein NQ317_003047 [Molorchus minor]|uniref:Uncharacterized protein n=1 Tax=Molorchus minor TaxID=1323400 RepID=A0ABQ9J2C6_9CUCU|nr:hypothetical protein NQ317_003047 [Molorchus minor]